MVELNSTEEKVKFLSQPEAYGPGCDDVEVRETRTSWVFLTESNVYKLKKPLKNSQFDFSTVGQREANARNEIALNRRLAPDVYLGVVALVRPPDHPMAIGGFGEPIDWLVHMQRLPEAGFLDHAIAEKAVRRAQVLSLAAVLAEFYAHAEAGAVPAEQVVASLRQQVLNARVILLDPRFQLSRKRIVRLTGEVLHDLRPWSPVSRRLCARPPVDGHGDLKPEHVWLGPPPLVIDCLEFNRTLRVVDPFDELSFLALECERLGAAWIGPVLLATVGLILGESSALPSLAFYRRLRAVLRASFALRHFLEPRRRKPGDWRRQAREYLHIAAKPDQVRVRCASKGFRLR
jgi:aminoglycoside phosphotransferase family enzyme